jgi:two-component system chemotaxis sensor kinase CheA
VSDIRQQLLAAFEVEHKEHVEAIRSALSRLRAHGTADMRDVFRHAHSLKGASRAVGLLDLEELAHRLETVFLRITESALRVDAADFDSLEGVLDLIEDYVAASNRGAAPPSLREAGAALDRIVQGGDRPTSAAAPKRAAEPERPAVEPSAVEVLRVPARQVEDVVEAMRELGREIHIQAARTAALATVRTDAREIRRQWETLRRAIDREASLSAPLAEALSAFERQLQVLGRGLGAEMQARGQSDWAVGEAVKQLREHVEQISLIPAETVFGDLARMTRELARAQDSTVDVSVSGLEVQADRSVLQRLREPLIHALRNAVSHGGRETPDERLAKSKPAALQIAIAIASRGGELAISIRDDGPGPDVAAIEARARAGGLLDDAGGARDAAALLELVFEPGFSTARAVDAIAGRGVGLSAVAEAVRRLKGRVRFQAADPGAELRLVVPLSTSRETVLFVASGDQIFGLPGYAVERLLLVRKEEVIAAENHPALRTELGGQSVVVPFFPLSRLLDMPTPEPSFRDGVAKTVLLRHGSRRLALQVDGFLDVQPRALGRSDAIAGVPPVVAGTAFLDADAPVLVLDEAALLDMARRPHAPAATLPEARSAAPARRAATILVVDDSITTRTLEKSILEAQGYRVLTSVDGVDALTALRSAGELVDLVVADIEMPRLDGFGLLQAMKNDPRLSSIPVIIVTSREDPSHVRRGLDLGAAAYITKQKFDQRELLATIGQFV